LGGGRKREEWEGKERSVGVVDGIMTAKEKLEALWEAFDVSSPPPEVEEALERGWWVSLRHFRGERELRVVANNSLPPWEKLQFHLFSDRLDLRRFPSAVFQLRKGEFEAEIFPEVFLGKGVAYFRTFSEESLKEALKNVTHFRPFLRKAGLSDLVLALKSLLGLKEGEARREGGYVLARGETLRVLGRGGFFADPLLEGALLLGKPVTLPSVEELQVTLKADFYRERVSLSWVRIQLGKRAVDLEGRHVSHSFSVLEEDWLSSLIREVFRYLAENPLLPGKITALAEEINEHKDPLKALRSEEVLRGAYLRALAQL
jgi:hypothetical protein